MDVDDPPPMDDEEGPFMSSGREAAHSLGSSEVEDPDAASVMASQVAAASLGADHDLSETKKLAVELLQGRVIE
jgi:hypothetical protein